MACLNASEEIEAKENEECLLRNTLAKIKSKLKLNLQYTLPKLD